MKCRVVRYDGKHYCRTCHLILGSWREVEGHLRSEQ